MVQTETKKEYEEPPGQRPPHLWEDLPWERWNDWRWQLRHSLNTLDERRQMIHPTSGEEIGVAANYRFWLNITPYFASLIASRSAHRLSSPQAGPLCLWPEQSRLNEQESVGPVVPGQALAMALVGFEALHQWRLTPVSLDVLQGVR